MRIRANPETTTLNVEELIKLFRSKDEKLWDQHRWIFEGTGKFLDGSHNTMNKVALVSYPRSGNQFLRSYVNLLTGTETGSDLLMIVSVQLQLMGVKGEEIVDDTVWAVKTHTPWIFPLVAEPFFCNKAIFIVRNPLDVIVSYIRLFSTGSHIYKPPFEYHEKYP